MGGFAFSHNAERRIPDVLREARRNLVLHNFTGASWARQDFWWSIANPREGVWEWTYFDQAIDSYERRGIRLLAILCYGSPWATGHNAPTDARGREAFGEFVYQMVKRYGDRVGAWEVWNEPDILPFWAPRPDARDYAELLKVVYRRAKEANPNAVVVAGALAMPDTRFLEGVFAAGAGESFDILSFHGYGQDSREDDFVRTASALRGVMRRHNTPVRPVWLTETGIYTGPAGVTEREQAAALARISLGTVGSGEIDKIFQLTLLDWDSDPNVVDATVFRGLLSGKAVPKPSFRTHRRLAAALGGRRGIGWCEGLASGVRGAAFGDPQHPLLALWIPRKDPNEKSFGSDAQAAQSAAESRKPGPRRLDLGAPAIYVTRLETGAETLLTSQDGIYTLEINDFPILIEGTGPEIGARALLRLGPQPLQAVAGARATLTIERLPDPLASARGHVGGALETADKPWSVEVLAPGGWSVTPEQFNLDAGGARQELEINVPMDTYINPMLRFRLHSRQFDSLGISAPSEKEAAGGNAAEAAFPIRLQPPFQIAWEPSAWLDPQKPVWNLKIRSGVSGALDVALRTGVSVAAGKDSAATPTLSQMPVRLSVKGDADAPTPIQALADPAMSVATVRLEAEAEAGGHRDRAGFERMFVAIPRAPQGKDAAVDGDLREWTSRPPTLGADLFHVEFFNPALYRGADDLSTEAWLGWDKERLLLAVHVHDDTIHLASSPTVWDNDSLQVGFDFGADSPPLLGYDDLNDAELQIARMASGAIHFSPMPFPPGRPQEPLVKGAKIAVTASPEKHEFVYEISLPWAALPLPAPPRAGTLFGFNLIVNDNDNTGR